MTGPEAWIGTLRRSMAETWFTLDFARLGISARFRSLSAAEISSALTLPGEAAARRLLYLACPTLQEAGVQLTRREELSLPEDITLALPYSDVLGAASIILQQSGGGDAMVQLLQPEEQAAARRESGSSPQAASSAEPPASSPVRAVPASDTAPASAAVAQEMDGYALLQQWAAQDRTAKAAGQNPATLQTYRADPDAFSAVLRLRQSWAETSLRRQGNTEATNSAPALSHRELSPATITPEQVARELCQRLCDAAGNM